MTVGGTDPVSRNSHDLRAPADDGKSLQEPPLDRAGELATSNRKLLDASDVQIGDANLGQMRRAAQMELLALATDHVASYQNDPASFDSPDGIVLSGHQPELFHPGVWYKNFALSSIAAKLNLAAVNLVIDTEVCQSTSIEVLSGSPADPCKTTIPFDAKPAGLPYESTKISNDKIFRSFPDEIEICLKDFGIAGPLCTTLWTHVLDASTSSTNLGYCLAAGRHLLEHDRGLRTLEVPLSKVCQAKSFAIFASHILRDLPRFVQIYNSALANYRTRNRLRSKTHPAPDLQFETDGQSNRLETPFWIWDAKDSQRRPMFVAHAVDQFIIDDRHVINGASPREIADEIFSLNSGSVSIRSRALITTMYARLVLGDLFIHGIGGAKYDAVTDEIIREFFGIQPPEFMTLSATCQLPVATPAVSEDDLQSIEQQLRDIRFHPEQFLGQIPHAQTAAQPDAGVKALIDEKKRLFQDDSAPADRKARHQRIEEINESLRRLAAPVEEELRLQQQTVEAALARRAILTSREYSFCLFPATLSDILYGLCRPDPS